MPINFNAMSKGRMNTFADINQPTAMQPKGKIEAIAHALLPGFIPKDKKETQLSFHFTIPPDSNYKVFFEKHGSADWQLTGYEEAQR